MQLVAKEHSLAPNQPCEHGCHWVIQFCSRLSGEVKYEACIVEAEDIAGKLLEAVDEGSKHLTA